MPIDDKWRKLIPEQLQNAPDVPGVYEFTDLLQESILYIGKTQSLMQTLNQIFEKKPPEFATATFFRFHATQDFDKEHTKLIDEYKQKHGNLPLVNQKLEEQS